MLEKGAVGAYVGPLALTGFAPVSSGSKPDILDYYTIGLGDIT